jgi:glutamine synthetase
VRQDDGKEEKKSAGDPVDADIFKMTEYRRQELGIQQLPASLREACQELQNDSIFLEPIFGKEVIASIIEHAKNEHMELAIRPHPHEFAMYADV